MACRVRFEGAFTGSYRRGLILCRQKLSGGRSEISPGASGTTGDGGVLSSELDRRPAPALCFFVLHSHTHRLMSFPSCFQCRMHLSRATPKRCQLSLRAVRGDACRTLTIGTRGFLLSNGPCELYKRGRRILSGERWRGGRCVSPLWRTSCEPSGSDLRDKRAEMAVLSKGPGWEGRGDKRSKRERCAREPKKRAEGKRRRFRKERKVGTSACGASSRIRRGFLG